MLKKTIVYENPFTGSQVSEEHYFHISKADLVEMEVGEHSTEYVDKTGAKLTGMQAKLQKIIDSEDGKAIMAEFKDIIRRAYGKKDGDRFLKSAAIWADFEASEAFSQLLWDLCTNAAAAAEFVNGVAPRGMIEQAAKEVASGQSTLQGETATPEKPEAVQQMPTLADRIAAATSENPAVLSSEDLAGIDSDELKSGLATGRIKLS